MTPLKQLVPLLGILFFTRCTDNTQRPDAISDIKLTPQEKQAEMKVPEPVDITYHIVKMNDSGKAVIKQLSDEQKTAVYALNRRDNNSGPKADSLIVPDKFLGNFMEYSPFPQGLPAVANVHKIVFFSYPIQAFGAYENGKLVRWGPTNMGRKDKQTPTGLFFSNWKAEETTSTFDDEWKLKWNFNIQNKEGVGWHQYAMPGYPASHSCLRLQEADAKWLYDWADQWVLNGNEEHIKAQGTPTVVFGSYPWGQAKPWMVMASGGSKANYITPDALGNEVNSFLPKIMAAQSTRDSLKNAGGI